MNRALNMNRRSFVKASAAGMALAAAGLATFNLGQAQASESGSEINVCIASEPDTIDPALNSAVDGATYIVHCFAGLTRWEVDADGASEVVADCATELVKPVANSDGTYTYTYTLKDGLKWSDGKDLTAADFEFAWKRAVSPDTAADYNYLYENVVGYDKIWETDDSGALKNPDAELSVTAKDDKTLEVVLTAEAPYWDQLLAFPTFMPVREDVVSSDSWATEASTYVCNGAYTIDSWEHNSVIRLKKNPNYHDADKVTMEQVNFYLSNDANNMLANFQNGSWQLIDDVPSNEIASLKTQYPDEFKITGNLGTYYVAWNVNESILPSSSSLTAEEAETVQAEIRNAISLLFDRNYIVTEIGQAGQQPAGSFVASGISDADGTTEFYENAGHNDGYNGYYDPSAEAVESNFTSAVETLKKYYSFDESTQQFTDFPTITYLYNTSEGHKAIGEYLQSALAGVGINMQLENQEWNTFLQTRKAGDFTIARNGWLADYNDPISFLDMWTTASGNNDVQLGKGDHASLKLYDLDLTSYGVDLKVEKGTWAETYDALIKLCKTTADKETRYKLMHEAEDLLMSTGTICPLYYYTDIYMIASNVKGFYSIPLGTKYFQETTLS